MAKAVKTKKGKGKYDITVKTELTADELLKAALNTPIKKKNLTEAYNEVWEVKSKK